MVVWKCYLKMICLIKYGVDFDVKWEYGDLEWVDVIDFFNVFVVVDGVFDLVLFEFDDFGINLIGWWYIYVWEVKIMELLVVCGVLLD